MCYIQANGKLSFSQQYGLPFKSYDQPLPLTDANGKKTDSCFMSGNPIAYSLVNVFDFQRNDSTYKNTQDVTLVFKQLDPYKPDKNFTPHPRFPKENLSYFQKENLFIDNHIHIKGYTSNPEQSKELLLKTAPKYRNMTITSNDYGRQVFQDSMTDVWNYIKPQSNSSLKSNMVSPIDAVLQNAQLNKGVGTRNKFGLLDGKGSTTGEQVIVVSAKVKELKPTPGQSATLEIQFANVDNPSLTNKLTLILKPANNKKDNWSTVQCVN